MRAEVGKNFGLVGRRQLPEVLCALHPPNRVLPELPIATLAGHEQQRMASATVGANEIRTRRVDEFGAPSEARHEEQQRHESFQALTCRATRWVALFR